jgi:hypothetical protein
MPDTFSAESRMFATGDTYIAPKFTNLDITAIKIDCRSGTSGLVLDRLL